MKRAGAMACSDAGFRSDGLAAGVPVLVADFVAALLDAGACASKVLHRTMLVNIDLM